MHNATRRVRLLVFLCLVLVAFAVNSCAHQPAADDRQDPPGFFMGFLHGFLMLFSFIGGLFSDIRIYAFPNSGGWYDFGYLLGSGLFCGAGGASSR